MARFAFPTLASIIKMGVIDSLTKSLWVMC